MKQELDPILRIDLESIKEYIDLLLPILKTNGVLYLPGMEAEAVQMIRTMKGAHKAIKKYLEVLSAKENVQ